MHISIRIRSTFLAISLDLPVQLSRTSRIAFSNPGHMFAAHTFSGRVYQQKAFPCEIQGISRGFACRDMTFSHGLRQN
jgi:hypothetical protein